MLLPSKARVREYGVSVLPATNLQRGYNADRAVGGSASGSENRFLGVPYAAPPTGALRWNAPQPASAWSRVRMATRFAPHCAQHASQFGMASTSDDCAAVSGRLLTCRPHEPTRLRTGPVEIFAGIWIVNISKLRR